MNRVTIFSIDNIRDQLFQGQQLLVSSLDDASSPVKAQLSTIDKKGRLCLSAAGSHPCCTDNHHAVRLCFGEEQNNDYLEITGITEKNENAAEATLIIIPFYCVQGKQETGIYRLHVLPLISSY